MNFPSRAHGFSPTRHNLFYGLGLAAMLLLTGCGKGAAESGAPPAGGGRGGGKGGGDVPVVTALVVVKPMSVKVRAVGNVEASSTVPKSTPSPVACAGEAMRALAARNGSVTIPTPRLWAAVIDANARPA